jgi:phosphohistidine phosphatase SixA
LLATVLLLGSAEAWASEKSAWIVLVRHAEKADNSLNAELSARGKERAVALADMLADAGIERVYSTDFIRTLDTARPLAGRLGLEPELYHPKELKTFASMLGDRGGRALVVGHSFTTPRLVELLGGSPGAPIAGDEYDRLYIVVIAASGEVTTSLIRFPPFGK